MSDIHRFGKRSWSELLGVRPELVAVCVVALREHPLDFGVHSGLRTKDQQRALVDAGASSTMNSRHLTGHAVDLHVLIDGRARWEFDLYGNLAETMLRASYDVGVSIEWGGVWASRDGPHFQLPWDKYP